MKTHEQLILGNSLETILLEHERYLPVISEYQFQREVLDLLENPFDIENIKRYSVYVGELTKPLRVVSNTNRDEVLFEVPAIVQMPQVTIPTGRGLSVEEFMQSLKRDMELGGYKVTDKTIDFLTRITKIPNYLDVVIRPIQAILARYGRNMIPIKGIDPIAPPIASSDPTGDNPQSAFSDEYED